jgi:hypothetical protein
VDRAVGRPIVPAHTGRGDRAREHLRASNSALAPHDRLVYRQYHALLMYKLQRRDELDRQIEQLAELPTLAPMVRQPQCFRGISLHSAMTGAIGIALEAHLLYHPAETLCLPGLRIRFGTQKDYVITRARGRRV